MQPTPGERYFLEEQKRRADAAQEQAEWEIQRASELASAEYAYEEAGQVRYEELRVDAGHVDLSAAEVHQIELPGEFGGTLSVVATIQAKLDGSSSGRFLWWYFATGFAGVSWHWMKPLGDSPWPLVDTDGSAMIRLHGPFAPHLAVMMYAKDTNKFDAPRVDSAWDVRLVVGTQVS